ncbi:thiamine diphosphokinase [Paraliobacillus sp. X-1268]|uniref:thiamine diphosphokinase n=1 Tax=Paraliobacillus sp. X-1268 TaxID=2213193 RepID=UPI000E3BD15B|nr:thiamine diphosphokinase [Paraliobacillus sp. X-1268]
MYTVAIVAGGPASFIPNLTLYQNQVDYWIGADKGSYRLVEENMSLDLAIGDFDSITEDEFSKVKEHAKKINVFSIEKDETDLDLAILEAMALKPNKLLIFGATGGRMDHTLANIQLLSRLKQDIQTSIIDSQNEISLFRPGNYEIEENHNLPMISFIPLTPAVAGLSLENFYYPLEDKLIEWGSTLCLSNKLIRKKGTFSFDTGILIMIKSRDVLIRHGNHRII